MVRLKRGSDEWIFDVWWNRGWTWKAIREECGITTRRAKEACVRGLHKIGIEVLAIANRVRMSEADVRKLIDVPAETRARNMARPKRCSDEWIFDVWWNRGWTWKEIREQCGVTTLHAKKACICGLHKIGIEVVPISHRVRMSEAEVQKVIDTYCT